MADMRETDNFIKTLTQTPPTAAQLSQNITRLKKSNDQLIVYLSYPQTVADDLTKLYNSLQTAYDLLTIISVIPEVGAAASAYKSTIGVLMKEVKPAKNAAVKLAAKVKPLRESLKKLDPIFDKGIASANKVNEVSASFLKNFTTVVSCINSLPDGQLKETAQSYLNQFSQKVDPEVGDLNKAMVNANSVIDTVYAKLEELKQALSPLAAIKDAVNQVLSVLDPLISVLSELKHDLMTIKIPIPLPYPHLVSLYDIFNTLGDFIELAMKPIQSLIDKLLDVLNIKLPSIPGLSDLLHININLPDIPDFSALIQEIMSFFDQFKININLFNLKCPPDPNQTDFMTQLGKA